MTSRIQVRLLRRISSILILRPVRLSSYEIRNCADLFDITRPEIRPRKILNHMASATNAVFRKNAVGSTRTFRRNIRKIIPLVFLMVGVCLCHSMEAARTLRTTEKLPRRELEVLCPPDLWKTIADLPIVSYVVFDARAAAGAKVKMSGIAEAHPNPSMEAIAAQIATRARIRTFTTGSNVEPQVDVYVVFFPPSKTKQVALLFAQLRGLSFVRPGSTNSYHLEICDVPGMSPSNAPPPAPTSIQRPTDAGNPASGARSSR